MGPIRSLLLVTAVAGVMLFSCLGSPSLTEPSEGRYAQIARTMAESGDWITPRLNGLPHLEKPPFAYWMAGLGIRWFGPSEYGARFLAALFGVGIVVLTFLLGRMLGGDATGLLAAAFLLAMPEFTLIARSITTDVFLAFWATAAVACFLRWQRDPGRPAAWRWAYFACIGAGFLTKGPVVLVPALVPILLEAGWRKDWAMLRALRPGRGLAFSVAIFLPWLLLAESRTSGLLRFLSTERLVRAFHSAEEFHGEPIWYFLPVLLFGCAPAVLFLPSALLRPWRPPASEDPNAWGARFLMVWWGVVFIFFSFSASKLITYILSLTVPIALIAGRVWTDLLTRNPKESERGGIPDSAAWGIRPMLWFALLMAAAVPLGRSFADPLVLGTRPALDPVRPLDPIWPIAFGIALVGLIFVAAISVGSARRSPRTLLGAVLLYPLVCLILGFGAWQELRREFNSAGEIGRALARTVRPEDPVVAYKIFPRGVPFYLGRPIPTIDYEKRDLRLAGDSDAVRDLVREGREEVYRLLQGSDPAFVITRYRYYWGDCELVASGHVYMHCGDLVVVIPKRLAGRPPP